MPDLIETIIETRKTASEIVLKCLKDINNVSELELRDRLLDETRKHTELFPQGWYDPPLFGISVLFAQKPFKRLEFNSMRNSEYFPKIDSYFLDETVGVIYLSPVDHKTGMIGDFSLTVYNGNDEEIKKHIKKCYEELFSLTEYVKVGMKFSDSYKYSMNLFKNEFKTIGEMTTNSDPNLGINLGHTIPGSFENNFTFGNSFEEVKNTIRTKRLYINEVENFIIPDTCAFTIEARLEDINKPELPKVYFHFIVCFNKGKKIVLENFDEIFKIAKMDYIYDK